jgi:hypothetical protein
MSVHAQTLNHRFRFRLVQTERELQGLIFGVGIGTGTGFYFLKEVECKPSSQFYFGVEPEIQLDLRFLKKKKKFEKRVTRTKG